MQYYNNDENHDFIDDLFTSINGWNNDEAQGRLKEYFDATTAKESRYRSGYPVPKTLVDQYEPHKHFDYPTGFYLPHEILPNNRDLTTAIKIVKSKHLSTVIETNIKTVTCRAEIEIDEELGKRAKDISSTITKLALSTYYSKLGHSVLNGTHENGLHSGIVNEARNAGKVFDIKSNSKNDILQAVEALVINQLATIPDAEPIVIMHPARYLLLSTETSQSLNRENSNFLPMSEISPYKMFTTGTRLIVDQNITLKEKNNNVHDLIVVTDRRAWKLWEEKNPVYLTLLKDQSIYSKFKLFAEGESSLVYTGEETSTSIIEGDELTIPEEVLKLKYMY